MTILRLFVLCGVAGMAGVASGNPLSFSENATITTGPVTLACYSGQPVAKVRLDINGVDQGLPGLIYVGAVEPGQRDARFFSEKWVEMGGGLMPIYAVERSGLKTANIVFPLDPQSVGWSIYVGYGALTSANEEKVQARRVAMDRARARDQNMRQNPITDDHLRATLIQMDMANNTKYRRVLTPTEADIIMCDDTLGTRPTQIQYRPQP